MTLNKESLEVLKKKLQQQPVRKTKVVSQDIKAYHEKLVKLVENKTKSML